MHTYKGYKGVPGWFDYEQLYDEMVERFDEGLFVELGNFCGASFLALCDKVRDSGKPIRCLAVDLYDVWDWETFGVPPEYMRYKNQLEAFLDVMSVHDIQPYDGFTSSNVQYIKGCSWDSAALVKEPVKFVFVDAGHGYQEVVNDNKAWEPLVVPGGVVAGHDWDSDGVRRAAQDTLPGVREYSRTTWIWEKNG